MMLIAHQKPSKVDNKKTMAVAEIADCTALEMFGVEEFGGSGSA